MHSTNVPLERVATAWQPRCEMPPSLTRRAFVRGATVAALAFAVDGCGTGATDRARRTVRPVRRMAESAPPVPRTLAEAIRGPVISRSSRGFAQAAHVYNERFDGVLPYAVARPLDVDDVSGAVRWAAAHDMRLVARSGGHSYAGYSTVSDGVVLDLRLMRSIHVDATTGTATIAPGAQLIDIYWALARQGATLPAGSCPSVGIAGHALGGGMGLAGRAFGLATDNLIEAQLVTADGAIRTVNRSTDPDLLWALRGGGGGNFGVATALKFKIHRVPVSAAWFSISFPWSTAADALAAWQMWAPSAANQLTSVLSLDAGGGTTSVGVVGQYLGRQADLATLLAPLSGLSGASVSSGGQDYFSLQLHWAGCSQQSLASCHTEGTRRGGTLPRASFDAKSDYVSRPLSNEARSVLVAAMESRLAQTGSGAILFDSYGGAINQIAPDAMAFVHRSSLCCMQYLSYGGGTAWLESTHGAMRPYVSGYAYQNYIDPALTDWRHAYYGSNYSRLVAVQGEVDPEHYFRFPQAIGS